MPALHVRNVDDAVITALKKRAKANHRSLEAELRVILEEAAWAADGETSAASGPFRLNLKTVAVSTTCRFDREEIYDEEGR